MSLTVPHCLQSFVAAGDWLGAGIFGQHFANSSLIVQSAYFPIAVNKNSNSRLDE